MRTAGEDLVSWARSSCKLSQLCSPHESLAVVVMSRNKAGLPQRLISGEKLQHPSAAMEKVVSLFMFFQ